MIFRYNLTWEQIGSMYNGQLQESGVSLDQIETVVPPNDYLRWLPVQVIEEDGVASFLAALDEACAIPTLHCSSPGSLIPASYHLAARLPAENGSSGWE